MARIRTIKPEFFRHEGLQDLEREHPGQYVMLTFVGLWSLCDKDGHFEWKPRVIKLDVLPFLEFDMEKTLTLLERFTYVRRYEVDGKTYGEVVKFSDHQRISGKEAQEPAKFPQPIEYIETNSRGIDWEAPGKHTGEQEREREREGKGKGNGVREMEGKGKDRSLSNAGALDGAEVESIFQHWQEVHGHPSAKLDDKRRKLIRAALKLGYTPYQLRVAIDGCKRTPHNMGQNDRHTVYDDLGLILRDADHIDRFIRNSQHQPRSADPVDEFVRMGSGNVIEGEVIANA